MHLNEDFFTSESLVEYTVQNKSGNKNTNVNALNQDEYDASIDERLPETVTLFTTPDGGKLYLVGTAHFSVESQNDVSMVNDLYLIYVSILIVVKVKKKN